MRIIDADAVIERLNKVCLTDDYLFMALKQGIDHAIAVINEASTIDAEPVKHGQWMERKIPLIPLDWDEDDVDTMYVCSECEGLNYCESYYCPHCGAKMDGERENHER